MRILYLITSTTVGGAERTLARLARGLDRKRAEPAGVICLKPLGPVAGEIESAGVPVRSLGMGYLPSPFDVHKLREVMDSFRPDIVHAFLYRAIQFARLAKGDWKLVSSPRVNYRTRPLPLRLIDRLGRNRDDMTVCEAQSTADFMKDELGYDPARLRVIRNGINPVSASPEESAKVRASLGFGRGDFIVLSAGRLSEQKGFPFLIEAMPEVLKKCQSVRLVIAGEGPDRPALERLIARLGLKDKVRLAGEQGNLSPWYGAADAFVLPSLWEGLPNCLLEAMSAGLPCAATAVDGTLEICQSGAEALLVPPANSGEMAKALSELCSNAALREKLSSNGRRNVEANFTMSRMLAQYEQAYEDVLSL